MTAPEWDALGEAVFAHDTETAKPLLDKWKAEQCQHAHAGRIIPLPLQR